MLDEVRRFLREDAPAGLYKQGPGVEHRERVPAVLAAGRTR